MVKAYELLMANPGVVEELRKRPAQKKPTLPKRLSTKVKAAAWRAARKAESDRIRALNKQRQEEYVKRRDETMQEEIIYAVNGEIVSREAYMEHIAK